ncbi:MAG: plastocyanin/azurin family copper-binding protein [Gemmatimonadota bacterium]
MLRALARTIVAASMTAALFACGSDGITAPPAAGTVVATTDLHYTPQSITLARSGGSATVTFTFQSVNHTVDWDTQPSGATAQDIESTSGTSVLRQLTVAGSYTYHCDIHPSMHGTIVIE